MADQTKADSVVEAGLRESVIFLEQSASGDAFLGQKFIRLHSLLHVVKESITKPDLTGREQKRFFPIANDFANLEIAVRDGVTTRAIDVLVSLIRRWMAVPEIADTKHES